MKWETAGPSEYLAITGWGIPDIKLAKNEWIFPGQKCTKFDVSPVNYTFEVQAMSAEKLPFILPADFTIGPRVTDMDSLLLYAKLISPHDKLSNHVKELVQGVIEGETRVLAASMTMEQVFKGTKEFKKEVFEKVQLELDQFGLLIYNANVKLVDVPGHEYFSYLGQKTQMEATNQAKVDAPIRGSTVPNLPIEDISVQQAAAPLPSSTIHNLPIEDISVQQGDSEINLVPHDGDSTQSQDSAPPATSRPLFIFLRRSRPLLFGYDRSQCLIKCQLFAISIMGGMVAGYCLQIGGAVKTKESLTLFGIYQKMEFTKTTNFCSFYGNKLDSLVACLYLAAAMSILPAFVCSKLYGRKLLVAIGFGLVLVGSILSLVKNLPTLFIGRIICGLGVGCILQVLPVYISESTPAKYAESLATKFDYGVNFGGFIVASTINYLLAETESGWRWSFGLSGALALASLRLCATIPESPQYFIEMKDIERAKNAFERTRGRVIVDEFDKLVAEGEGVYVSLSQSLRLENMPYLIIACVREVFMQMTGMFAINFFTPVFLTSVGVSTSTSYISSMAVGYTNFIMVILGAKLFGRYKRRVVLRSSASVMAFTLFMIFGLLRLNDYSVVYFEVDVAVAISVYMFFYVGAYSVISGPLGWLSVPLPRRAKSMGSVLTLKISMLLVSLMAYMSVPVGCAYKEYIVLLFAIHALAMEAFINILVPETKNISEEEMNAKAWGTHRFWKKCI